MADEPTEHGHVSAVEGTPAPRTGHRPVDPREALAELTAKAHQIRQEAGGLVAVAMKDVIAAATGMAGFAIESARDLVQFLVRRGQMSQEEADRIVRDAEAAHAKRPASERDRPTASKMAADRNARAKADAAAAAAAAVQVRAAAPPAKAATPVKAVAPAKVAAPAKTAAPVKKATPARAAAPKKGASKGSGAPARAPKPVKPTKAAAKKAPAKKPAKPAAKAPARKAAAPARAAKKTARKR